MSSYRVLGLALFATWVLGSSPGLTQTSSPAPPATAPSGGPSAAPPATAPSAAPPATASSGAVDPNEYRIGPEDVLHISVWKNEAISRTVPVRPDGKITLPLLNDIDAAGLTPMQFRDLLAQRLTEFMPSPEVSVIVTEPRSFKVSILGEVPKPGRYELRSRTTVLDAIALAGGLTQWAARSKLFVLRPDGKTQKRLPFNYNRAVSADGEQENFPLQAGDVLVIP
jgi:polysaccharide export outer membrane protein